MPASIKKINNCDYIYYRYYKDGKRRDLYCGSASKPESIRKSLEFELEYLENQSRGYAKQAAQIKKQLQAVHKNIKNKNM